MASKIRLYIGHQSNWKNEGYLVRSEIYEAGYRIPIIAKGNIIEGIEAKE